MSRNRIKTTDIIILVRSTNKERNSKAVRKIKQHKKRIEKLSTGDVIIKDAFGTKGRYIHIGL